jgi:hypothetical protein
VRYLITTPVRGFRGEVAGVAFIDSKAEVDEDGNGRAIAYFRRKGYGVEAVEPAAGPAAPATEQDEQDQQGEIQRPGGNAKKETLIAYAVAVLGMTEQDADAKTRVELLDLIDKHEKGPEQ